ncbi:MAG TPA: HEAT repeat domain-containing protein [Gammaproteobacteria bacterium]
MPSTVPDALLFITPGCPHCPVVLQGLSEMVKQGTIGKLTVINAAAHPELVAEQGVRAAPWLRLGPFTLTGAQTQAQLQQWAVWAGSQEGLLHYLEHLFKAGDLKGAETFIAAQPERLVLLLAIITNPEEAITVRLGANALLEGYAGRSELQALLPQLTELSRHDDHRIRVDACHLLGLTASTEARPALEACLRDENAEVRDIATDALATLPQLQ